MDPSLAYLGLSAPDELFLFNEGCSVSMQITIEEPPLIGIDSEDLVSMLQKI